MLVDMQGPELRIGRLRAPLMLCENETAVLFSENLPEEDRLLLRREGRTAVSVPDAVCRVICPGSEILMDDGRLLVRALETRDGFAEVSIVRGGMISGRKSIKVIGADIHPPTMTNADLQNIRDASSYGVTGIMQPFVRSRDDLITVRRALSKAGCSNIRLFAKIENLDGVRKIDELLPWADEIVIARGDLGNAVPLWTLPAVQKDLAEKCRHFGTPFMVVTQMLASMEKNPVPTRAEVSDIFNAVLDGASSVMVTGETAVGQYPVEVIDFLARTVREAQKYSSV